ncbi:hypothetical protein OB952_23100, partial [Aeromonas salmonicida]|uniref:hypothetical protein n=1 Tax=Aeromonas salmonicida TaxID=645 RepID=UPI00259E717A
HGVCQCHKQTEYPWSACQKAPSVTVTWGWGSCGLMVDLGNSAHKHKKAGIPAFLLPAIWRRPPSGLPLRFIHSAIASLVYRMKCPIRALLPKSMQLEWN